VAMWLLPNVPLGAPTRAPLSTDGHYGSQLHGSHIRALSGQSPFRARYPPAQRRVSGGHGRRAELLRDTLEQRSRPLLLWSPPCWPKALPPFCDQPGLPAWSFRTAPVRRNSASILSPRSRGKFLPTKPVGLAVGPQWEAGSEWCHADGRSRAFQALSEITLPPRLATGRPG
jgi:hypothetical protein